MIQKLTQSVTNHVNLFKSRLDKFWKLYDFVYDYKAFTFTFLLKNIPVYLYDGLTVFILTVYMH